MLNLIALLFFMLLPQGATNTQSPPATTNVVFAGGQVVCPVPNLNLVSGKKYTVTMTFSVGQFSETLAGPAFTQEVISKTTNIKTLELYVPYYQYWGKSCPSSLSLVVQ